MASKARVTWNQYFTDFVFELKSGAQLLCHKFVLASGSPVLKAMLTREFLETENNRMTLDQFEEETVITFLQYLYVSVLKGHEQVERDQFNFDLLKMADYFQVQDLKNECLEQIKANIFDDNVMSVWMEAEKRGLKTLCSASIKHLSDRRPGDPPLQEVPGFSEAFDAQCRPLMSLFSALCDQNLHLRVEVVDLKDKIKELEDGTFKLTVVSKHKHMWTEEFQVKPSDTIQSLLRKIENRRPLSGPQCYVISKNQHFQNSYKPILPLRETSTLQDNNIHMKDALFVYVLV